VLVTLRKLNPVDRHLFWLFENVSSMQADTRQTISRFLEVYFNHIAIHKTMFLHICRGIVAVYYSMSLASGYAIQHISNQSRSPEI